MHIFSDLILVNFVKMSRLARAFRHAVSSNFCEDIIISFLVSYLKVSCMYPVIHEKRHCGLFYL